MDKKIIFRFRILFLFLTCFSILLSILLLYSFKTDSFYRGLVIFPLAILVLLFSYFFFKPFWVIKKRKELMLLFIILILFFILFEVALRVSSCERRYDFFPESSIKHKHSPNEMNCNQILDGERFYRISNSLGFMDDEFNFEENDYNIFLIGDSFAQCLQSEEDSCVYQKLERDLREGYGDGINVFNFGVGWYGGLQEAAIVREYIDDYRPKMVIMYFLAQNDLVDNIDYLNNYSQEFSIRSFVRKITPKSFIFIAMKTRNIFDKIDKSSDESAEKNRYNSQGVKNYEVYLTNYSQEWEELMNLELSAILDVRNVALENNATFILVGVTSPEQVYDWHWNRILEDYPFMKEGGYDLDKPTDIVMNFAEENEILHLNLIPYFRENPENLHWEKDGHWNSRGQEFASELIKNYIDENNLIKL